MHVILFDMQHGRQREAIMRDPAHHAYRGPYKECNCGNLTDRHYLIAFDNVNFFVFFFLGSKSQRVVIEGGGGGESKSVPETSGLFCSLQCHRCRFYWI